MTKIDWTSTMSASMGAAVLAAALGIGFLEATACGVLAFIYSVLYQVREQFKKDNP